MHISTIQTSKSRPHYKIDRRHKEALRRACSTLEGNALRLQLNALYCHISENISWGSHLTFSNKRRHNVHKGEFITNLSEIGRAAHMRRQAARHCLSILQEIGVIKVEKRPKYALAISLDFKETAEESEIHPALLPPSLPELLSFEVPTPPAQGFQVIHLDAGEQMKNSLIYREEEVNINIYRQNSAEILRGDTESDWEMEMLKEYAMTEAKTLEIPSELQPWSKDQAKKEIFGEVTIDQVAKDWLTFALREMNWRTPPKQWSQERFEVDLKKVIKASKLSVRELYDILRFVSTDPFWKFNAWAPNRLLKKASKDSEFNKIDNIIIAMKKRGKFRHGTSAERSATVASDQRPW